MRIETIKLYKFEELNQEAQERAIKDFQEDFEPYWDWYEYTLEDLSNTIKEKTGLDLDPKEFEFDLYSSRYLTIKESEVVGAMGDIFNGLSGIYQERGYYGDGLEDNMEVVFEEEFEDDEEESLRKLMELRENKQKEKEVIEKLVILEELLREGYNVLQEEYDYFFTDEFAKNELIERELEFKENGEKY